MTVSIDSRRGALRGPFVRWADVAEPGPGIVVQAVHIAEGWVYMMEPGQGYVVRQQVHASEQVVQVVQGSLRLQIGSDERLLTPDDIAVVPIGTYHRGLVTTPSRIFELNTPADPKNLFDPALGEQALQYPRAGATLRTANGHVLGPFARWPRVAGGAVKNLFADRVHVQHLTVAAGTEVGGTTDGTVVVQPLRGRIRLRFGDSEQVIDSGWVAIAAAGTPWAASCPDGAELLEVRFRAQGPVAAIAGLLAGLRR